MVENKYKVQIELHEWNQNSKQSGSGWGVATQKHL